MFARRILLAAVAGALLFSCACGGEESPPKLDLVGKHRPESSDGGQVAGSPDPGAIHHGVFVIDLIQDLVFRKRRDGWTLTTPGAHVNLDKLREGGLDLIFSAVQIEPGKKPSLSLEEGIAQAKELISQTGGKASIVSSLAQARAARKKGVMPVMLLIEGADGLEESTSFLYDLRRRGVGIIGLVAGKSNVFAEAAVTPGDPGGLTSRGARLVQICRDQGILVDLTHASQRTFWDVLVEQGNLVAVTHTAAGALREHPRNLNDIQILALARYGGVMGIVFNPDFLVAGEDPVASIDDVVRHMLHVKKIGALDSLAIGTDYGGVRPPKGLEDVSRLPALTAALVKAGFSARELGLVLGGNAQRLLVEVEARQGAAEAGRSEPLRPIEVECESVTGGMSGRVSRACDGYLLKTGPMLEAATRLKLRIQDMQRTPVRVEIFGEANTPWQVEAQNLEGKVLMRRGVALDRDGRGVLPLPEGRNLVRVFLSPTRPSILWEAVLWGR